MFDKLTSYLQYLYPQHLLSQLAGKLADNTSPQIKNYLIDQFIRAYKVDMSTAIQPDPHAYPSFNDFFTRKLKPELRPIAPSPAISCPVDGRVSQIGQITDGKLLQAKGHHYSLISLLANHTNLNQAFNYGHFVTLYLAPSDYHRVHMPLSGELRQSIFVPGKLFSVNNATANTIPNLFARNERVINIFETEAGKMAVIMVGALIVGSMQMVWQQQTMRHDQIVSREYGRGSFKFNQGDELGLFKLGSTVILLFENQHIQWNANLSNGTPTQYGQAIGQIKANDQLKYSLNYPSHDPI